MALLVLILMVGIVMGLLLQDALSPDQPAIVQILPNPDRESSGNAGAESSESSSSEGGGQLPAGSSGMGGAAAALAEVNQDGEGDDRPAPTTPPAPDSQSSYGDSSPDPQSTTASPGTTKTTTSKTKTPKTKTPDTTTPDTTTPDTTTPDTTTPDTTTPETTTPETPVTPTTPPPPSLALPEDPIERVNAYRTLAGVSLIAEDAAFSDGAQKHALYMAANRILVYTEDPAKLYYTVEGYDAASQSNLWFGNGVGMWEPWAPIDAWMESPFHRLWILHPQAAWMGYGFAEDDSGRGGATAAALRVFGGWDTDIPYSLPLKYPADNQEDIPPTRYGVSLQFPPFTSNPTFTSVSWVDEGGNPVAYESFDPESSPYMRDYGNAIFLYPDDNLAPGTTYTVHMQGSYNGETFDIEWSFTTGGG
jgi:uncharacterized protein YkwD